VVKFIFPTIAVVIIVIIMRGIVLDLIGVFHSAQVPWLKGKFSGANLRGMTLNSAKPMSWNTPGADLSYVNLSYSRQHRSEDSDPPNLSDTILTGANLTRADLSNADLSRIKAAGARLYRATLSSANLTEADLTGCDLRRSSFNRALLCNSKLIDADARRARFIGADLTNADFSYADLRGADFSNERGWLAKVLNVRQDTILTGAKFVGVKCDGATKFPEGFICQSSVRFRTNRVVTPVSMGRSNADGREPRR